MEQQPKPSEVRERILAEHAVIREHLVTLDELVSRLARGESPLDDARAAARALHRELMTHMKGEESMLVPALAEADGFGPARVEELQREHHEQGEALAALIREIDHSPGAAELESRLRELIRRIREDMTLEEKTHLSPNVLKDSVVTGAFGG